MGNCRANRSRRSEQRREGKVHTKTEVGDVEDWSLFAGCVRADPFRLLRHESLESWETLEEVGVSWSSHVL